MSRIEVGRLYRFAVDLDETWSFQDTNPEKGDLILVTGIIEEDEAVLNNPVRYPYKGTVVVTGERFNFAETELEEVETVNPGDVDS